MLRYHQCIYNWSIEGVAGSFYYRIGVELADSSTHYVNISLR